MFGFGSSTPAEDQTKQEPQETLPEGLAAIDDYEKARLVKAIEANKYVRRNGAWNFRNGLDLRVLLARICLLLVLFFIAAFTKAGNMRGREDRKWLKDFTLVILIWFVAVHTFAYLPSRIFHSFRELRQAIQG